MVQFSVRELYPLAGLVEHLDLQSNLISDIRHFRPFIRLTYLVLDDNPIERFKQ